jgi:NifB/MoaA-like Fe-S oxidoreductase
MGSVSIVPAGLTKFRDKLYPLTDFSPEEARDVIALIDSVGEKMLKEHGSRMFFAADEFYLKSGIPIPESDYYEGYPQIENGVGMIRSMQCEFDDELEFLSEYDLEKGRRLSIATGEAAYDFISSLANELMRRVPTLRVTVYRIENRFFGKNITVAGLITGGDLLDQLIGKPLGERLLIPSVMLRAEGDMFLDSITLIELSEKLGVPVIPGDTTGTDFISKILF